MRVERIVKLLAAVLLAVLGSAAHAVQQLDAIVAVVDDDVVLASELLTRLESVRTQMQAQGIPMPPRDIVVSQLMERLIMESIQLQFAERAGVRVDDETLTRAISTIAADNGMNLDRFRAALARDGISYREFREQIRREMVINRVQRGRVNSRINVSAEEIDAFLESPLGQRTLSDEFRVGHILLTVPQDATDAAKAAARREAEAIYRELVNGAGFRQLAIARSSGSRALEGGDLGWRKAGELPTLFAEEVLELEVGETARPVRSSGGWHIVQLLDRRGAGTEQVQQTLVRHILVRPSEIRSEADTEALIRDIHARLEAGESFEELAAEHSEDPGSALAGGELGWSTAEQFVPEFAAIMEATGVGEISRPFQTQFGWHILKVEGRRQEDLSEEARRNMAMRVLHSRRFEEELQEWLTEIRNEAYVEIRLSGADEGADESSDDSSNAG